LFLIPALASRIYLPVPLPVVERRRSSWHCSTPKQFAANERPAGEHNVGYLLLTFAGVDLAVKAIETAIDERWLRQPER
jgi:hypothetical protein